MGDYLYNLYDEGAKVIENEDGTAAVTFPNGKEKTFRNWEAATNILYRNGFRF